MGLTAEDAAGNSRQEERGQQPPSQQQNVHTVFVALDEACAMGNATLAVQQLRQAVHAGPGPEEAHPFALYSTRHSFHPGPLASAFIISDLYCHFACANGSK